MKLYRSVQLVTRIISQFADSLCGRKCALEQNKSAFTSECWSAGSCRSAVRLRRGD